MLCLSNFSVVFIGFHSRSSVVILPISLSAICSLWCPSLLRDILRAHSYVHVHVLYYCHVPTGWFVLGSYVISFLLVYYYPVSMFIYCMVFIFMYILLIGFLLSRVHIHAINLLLVLISLLGYGSHCHLYWHGCYLLLTVHVFWFLIGSYYLCLLISHCLKSMFIGFLLVFYCLMSILSFLMVSWCSMSMCMPLISYQFLSHCYVIDLINLSVVIVAIWSLYCSPVGLNTQPMMRFAL